jgi:hypothetical protein
MIKLHQSGLKQWQRCERRYMIMDTEVGLGYEREGVNLPVVTGSIFHWAHHFIYGEAQEQDVLLAARLGTERYLKELAVKGITQSTELDEIIAEAHNLVVPMLQNYRQHWGNMDRLYNDTTLKFLHTEYAWEVPFEAWQLAGRWDGIVEDEAGLLWVFEIKTSNDPLSIEVGTEFSWQPQLYTYAARKLFPAHNVAGVIYSVVQRTNPLMVARNQNGLPSAAKDNLAGVTEQAFYEAYIDGVARLGRDLSLAEERKYKEAFLWFKANEPVFVRRFAWTRKSAPQVLESMLRSVFERMEVVHNSGGKLAVPSWAERDCLQSCPVRDICLTLGDGEHWDYIKSSLRTGG